MSKPYGLTALLQVTTPNRATDAIWDAVEMAIEAGVTPLEFKREVVQAWHHALREKAKAAEKELLS